MDHEFTIRLHPSVLDSQQPPPAQCLGRFEVTVTRSTLIEDLIALLRVRLVTNDMFRLSRQGERVNCKDCGSLCGDQVVLEYSRVVQRQLDKGVQTKKNRKRAPRGRERVNTFPPAGVSRFKYLRIRLKSTS